MRDIELGVVGVCGIEHSLMYWRLFWDVHGVKKMQDEHVTLGTCVYVLAKKWRTITRWRSGQSYRKKSEETEAAWNLQETWGYSSLSHGLARVSAEGLNCPKSPTLVFSFPISTCFICLCTGLVPLGSHYLGNSRSKTRHFNIIISRPPFKKDIFSLITEK